MTEDALRAKVTRIALEHASLSGEELLGLLEYEWDRAGLAIADRGPASDFLRGVVVGVWRQAKQQRDTVEVTAAMAADSALHWAAQYGWASDRYALVAGLIAAWVTRAVLDNPDGPGDAEGPGGTGADGK
jgi:hypothetical protein